MIRKNLIIVVTGPSGAGKSTIVDYLVKKLQVVKLTTFTTRSPRNGEIPGKSYYYVSKEEFKNVDKIEETEYANNLYGVGKKEFSETIAKHDEICVILESKGVKYMKDNYPDDVIVIYVDMDKNLMTERLSQRGDNSKDIATRVANTEQIDEFDSKKAADYVIFNNDLQESLDNVDSIIRKEMKKNSQRNMEYLKELFISEIKKLSDEFCSIDRLWEELQFKNSYEFDDEVLGYPFEQSFDEVTSNVLTWRDNVLEFMKKDLSELNYLENQDELVAESDNIELLHIKFQENINKLYTSFKKISELWETLENRNNYDLNEKIEGYPFNHSVDEMTKEILVWNNNVSKFVGSKYNKSISN